MWLILNRKCSQCCSVATICLIQTGTVSLGYEIPSSYYKDVFLNISWWVYLVGKNKMFKYATVRRNWLTSNSIHFLYHTPEACSVLESSLVSRSIEPGYAHSLISVGIRATHLASLTLRSILYNTRELLPTSLPNRVI